MTKLNGPYIALLRDKPEKLFDDLRDQEITQEQAIIAVGMLLYGKGADALFCRREFRDFWEGRISGKKSFEAATRDTRLTAEQEGYVRHMHKVEDRLQRLSVFEGCWDILEGHTVFKVANTLVSNQKEVSVGADIEGEDEDRQFGADVAIKAGVRAEGDGREMSSGDATRVVARVGIPSRPYQP